MRSTTTQAPGGRRRAEVSFTLSVLLISAHPRARCRNVGVREGSFGCDGRRGSGRRLAAREVVQRAGNRPSGSEGRGGFARRKEQLRWRALGLFFEKNVIVVVWLR